MNRIQDLRKYTNEEKSTIILSKRSMEYLLRIAEAAEQVDKVFHMREKAVPPENYSLFPGEKSALRKLNNVLGAE